MVMETANVFGFSGHWGNLPQYVIRKKEQKKPIRSPNRKYILSTNKSTQYITVPFGNRVGDHFNVKNVISLQVITSTTL